MSAGLWLDFRQAWRKLRQSNGSSLAQILIVMVGVGLASAMFGLADPYVNARLPYQGSEQLIAIKVRPDGVTRDAVLPTVDEWRQRRDLFTSLSAAQSFTAAQDCSVGDRVVRLRTVAVSSDFLPTLGIAIELAATSQATSAAREIPVVLTAQAGRRLGSEAAGPSRTLVCGPDRILRVAGMLPEGFRFPDPTRTDIDGLVPFEAGSVLGVTNWMSDGRPAGRTGGPLMIGRVKPGRRINDVTSAMMSVSLPSGAALQVDVEPLTTKMTGTLRPLALGSLAAALLLLLVCAGNFANLRSALTLHQATEVATRFALGASRWQIVRTTVIELIVLATACSVLSVVIASAVIRFARNTMPASYLSVGDPVVGPRTIGFALVAALSVVAVGLLSAMPHLLRRNVERPRQSLSVDGRHIRRVRFISTAGQAALAMILAVGGTLLVCSYLNLLRQDTGLRTDVAVLDLALPFSVLNAQGQVDIDGLVLALRGVLPGANVAATDAPIVDGGMRSLAVRLDADLVTIDAKTVTAGFFDVTGIRLIAGREALDESSVREIVVSKSLAESAWPGQSPIGRSVTLQSGTGQPAVVVGVVNDVFDRALDVQPKPTMYLRFQGRDSVVGLRLLVRSADSIDHVVTVVQRTLFRVSPNTVLVGSGTIGERLADSVRGRTFATFTLFLFSLASLVIAVVGIVGMVSYSVARRTREFALRIALGASINQVRRLAVADTLAAVLVGGVVGTLAGRSAGTALRAFTYAVVPGDWIYPLSAAGGFFAIAVLAAFLAARPAGSLNISASLRLE